MIRGNFVSRQGLTLGLRPLLVYKRRIGLLWRRQIANPTQGGVTWNKLYVLVPGVKKKIAGRRVAYTVGTFVVDRRHKESWS